jgi:di/tricarboxylate transporter
MFGLPPSLHPYIAVGVTIFVFLALQFRRGMATDLLFLFGLVIVTLTGVISPEEALRGFANPAPLTVAGLLAVAAGLRATGVLDWVGHTLLGKVQTERKAIRRLAAALISASAFMLNTAVVAMMMPVVIDWCRRRNISPSRLLIPLSYLTILGGVCTLVGTSTTLVVNGMLREEHIQRSAALEQKPDEADTAVAKQRAGYELEFVRQVEPMHLFELGYVGLPVALIGGAFLILVAPRLLPDRTDIVEQLGDHPREYLVEMLVQPHCQLVGSSVQEAGLRQLPGLFLI